MRPLAEYSERFVDLKRNYSLYPDRITGRIVEVGKRESEVTVMINSLDPLPIRSRMRRGWFLPGILLCIACWLPGYFVFANGMWRDTGWLGLLLVSIGAVGGAMAYLDRSRREHLIFRNKAGIPTIGFIRTRRNEQAVNQFIALMLHSLTPQPEQSAAPNGGPAPSSQNPNVSDGPPSVS